MRAEDLIFNDPEQPAGHMRLIGSDPEFLERLNSADDWSAVILAWALIEASLTEAICTKLMDDSIREVIREMPLNGKACKVKMAAKLGLISASEEKFITTFSYVRNRFAHGLHWFGSSLDAFMAQETDRKRFESALIFAEGTLGGQTVSFDSHPRVLTIANALFLCFNAVGIASYDEDSEAQSRYEAMMD